MTSSLPVRYLTDGISLYEIVAEHCDRNYGLTAGEITATIIRDCVTEQEVVVDQQQLAALSAVH